MVARITNKRILAAYWRNRKKRRSAPKPKELTEGARVSPKWYPGWEGKIVKLGPVQSEVKFDSMGPGMPKGVSTYRVFANDQLEVI